jgi:integrase
MAYIGKYKTKNGKTRWRAEVKLQGIKPIYKSFCLKSDAQEWVEKTTAQAKRQQAGIPQTSKHTIAEAIDKYFAEYVPQKRDQNSFKTHLKWWRRELGHRYIHTILPIELVECRNKLQTEPYLSWQKGKKTPIPTYDEWGKPVTRAPRTVKKYLDYMSIVFSTAITEWGWIDDNPMMRVKKPKFNNTRIRYLSDYYFLWPGDKKAKHWKELTEVEKDTVPIRHTRAYELPRLMEAFKSQMNTRWITYKPDWGYNLFVIRLGTGLRPSEALNLVWEENNLIKHPIVIVDLQREVLVLKSTKMDDTPRVKPLIGEPLKVLQKMYKTRRTDTPIVFTRPDGLKPRDLTKRVRKAISEAELVDFHWHDVRHTTASYLGMMGAGQREIMEALHHKTLQASERYQHVSATHMKNLMWRYNTALFDDEEEMSRYSAPDSRGEN